MGCTTSQAKVVSSATTKENGINERAEADRKYRKYIDELLHVFTAPFHFGITPYLWENFIFRFYTKTTRNYCMSCELTSLSISISRVSLEATSLTIL